MEKVNCLFLIIGGTQLPNYITASSRLNENGVLCLFYTDKTKNYAEKLTNLLKENFNKKIDIKEFETDYINE